MDLSDCMLRKGDSRQGEVSFGSHRGHLGGAWSPQRAGGVCRSVGVEGGAV